MEIKKIFIATQNNVSVGVTLGNAGSKLSATAFKSVSEKFSTTKLSALEILVSQISHLDYENIKEPVQIFINDHLYKNIVNGYYKYWLFTGKTQEGEEIEEEELDMWQAFNEVYSQYNAYLIIKSTSEAKLSEYTKSMEGKRSRKTGKLITITPSQKINDKYSTYCWDKVKEFVVESSDIEENLLEE